MKTKNLTQKERKNPKLFRFAIIGIVCVIISVVVGLGFTFSWFSSEKSVINGVLTMGDLDVDLAFYRYSFDALNAPTLVSSQEGTYTEGIFDDTMQWQTDSHGVTYVKVTNNGNIAAKIYMKMLLNGGSYYDEYGYNYIYISFTDITADVTTQGTLANYASYYNQNPCQDTAVVQNGHTLGQFISDKYLLGQDTIPAAASSLTPTVKYYRMDYCGYNIPTEYLSSLQGTTISDLTAVFYIKQGNYTEDATSSGQTISVDSASSFIEATKVAQNGDTIVLSADIDLPEDTNITIYNRVNLNLNGYSLTVHGNFAYDVVSYGQCSIDASDSSELIVEGTLSIDAPSCKFNIMGTGNFGIRLGEYDAQAGTTTGGDFYIKTINDDNVGMNLSNIKVVRNKGDNATYINSDYADITVDSYTALRISAGTQVGDIIAANNAYRIYIENRGVVNQIDLSAMGYLGLNSTPQIKVLNYNRILETNMSIKLPYWSRGRINSYDVAETVDPNYNYDDETVKGFQVNTSIVKCAGSVAGMTVGVKYHYNETGSNPAPNSEGVFYTADSRAIAKSTLSTQVQSTDAFNYIFFFNNDIELGDSTVSYVTRTSANNYIVTLYGYAMADNSAESVEKRLDEYFAGEGLNYASEGIVSLTLRTYNSSVITAADFNYLRTDTTRFSGLKTLNLSAANMENGTIPENAMNGKTTLENLTLPLTSVAIGRGAFVDTAIHFVTVADTVTSLGKYTENNQTKYAPVFLPYDRNSANPKLDGYVFITWDSGVSMPTSVVSGLDADHNMVFMSRSLLAAFRTANPDFVMKSYEQYDGIYDNSVFYKLTSTSAMRIVYYHGTAVNNMVANSYTINGTEYSVTAIGDSAYRYAIYKLNNDSTKTDAAKFVTLVFPQNCKSIGDYAFYEGRFSVLDLYNVDTFGIACFRESQIQVSQPRAVGFSGVQSVGDYAFYGATIGTEIDVSVSSTVLSSFTSNCVSTYHTSNGGQYPYSYTENGVTTYYKYNGGNFDFSGSYTVPQNAFRNMRFFGVEVDFSGAKDLNGSEATESTVRNPFESTAFYGCYINLNGVNYIGKDVFASAISSGYAVLQRFTVLDIRNVSRIKGSPFASCMFRQVYAGIDSATYTSQDEVDYVGGDVNNPNCYYSAISTPIFYNATIDDIDISGWLPSETNDNMFGLFASSTNTTYKTVTLHNMASTRLPGYFFRQSDTSKTLTIESLSITAAGDFTFGKYAFQNAHVTSLNLVTTGAAFETYAFEKAQIGTFTQTNPQTSSTDLKFISVGDYAFSEATISSTAIEIDLSDVTILGTGAFYHTVNLVGSVVVGPAITELKTEVFDSTKITTLELQGVTTIKDGSNATSGIDNCCQLVRLKAPKLVNFTPKINNCTSLTEIYLGEATMTAADLNNYVGVTTMFETAPNMTNLHIFVPNVTLLTYFRTQLPAAYKSQVVLEGVAAYASTDNPSDYTYNGVELGHFILMNNGDNTYRVVGVNSMYSTTAAIGYIPGALTNTTPAFDSASTINIENSQRVVGSSAYVSVTGLEFATMRYTVNSGSSVSFGNGVTHYGYTDGYDNGDSDTTNDGYFDTFGGTITSSNADYRLIKNGNANMSSLVFPANTVLGSEAFKSVSFPKLATLTFGTNSTIGTYAFSSATFTALTNLTIGSGSTVGNSAFSGCTMSASSTKTASLIGCAKIDKYAFHQLKYGGAVTKLNINATETGIIEATAFSSDLGTVTVGVTVDDASYCFGGELIQRDGTDSSASIFCYGWYGTYYVNIEEVVVVGKIPANSVESALGSLNCARADCWITIGNLDLSACTQLTPHVFDAQFGSSRMLTINNTTLSTSVSLPDYCFYYCNFPKLTTLVCASNSSIGKYAFYNCSFAALTNLTIGAGSAVGDYAFASCAMSATGTKTITLTGCASIGYCAFLSCTFGTTSPNVNARNIGIIKAAAFGSSQWGTVTVGVATDDARYVWGGTYTSLWASDSTAGIFTGSHASVGTLVIDGMVPSNSVEGALVGWYYSTDSRFYNRTSFGAVDLTKCTGLVAGAFNNNQSSATYGVTIGNITLNLTKLTSISASAFQYVNFPKLTTLTIGASSTIGTSAFQSATFSALTNLTISSGSTIETYAFYKCKLSAGMKNATLTNVASVAMFAFSDIDYGSSGTKLNIYATGVGNIDAAAFGSNLGTVQIGVTADNTSYQWGAVTQTLRDYNSAAGIFSCTTKYGTLTVDNLVIIGKVPGSAVNALSGYYGNSGNDWSNITYGNVDLSACTGLSDDLFYNDGCGTVKIQGTSIDLTHVSSIPENAFRNVNFTNLTSIDAHGISSIEAGAFLGCTCETTTGPDLNVKNVGIIAASALASNKWGTLTLGVDTDNASYVWGGVYGSNTTAGIFAGTSTTINRLVLYGMIPSNSQQSALAGTTNNITTFNDINFTSCTGLTAGAFYAAIGSSTTYTCLKSTSLNFSASLDLPEKIFAGMHFTNLTTLTVASGGSIGVNAFWACQFSAATSKTITLTGVASIGAGAFSELTYGSSTVKVDIEATEVGIIGPAAFGSNLGTVTIGVTTDNASYAWGGPYAMEKVSNISDSDTGIFCWNVTNYYTIRNSVTIDNLVIKNKVPSRSCNNALAAYWPSNNEYFTAVIFNNVDLSDCTQLTPYAFYNGRDGVAGAYQSQAANFITMNSITLPTGNADIGEGAFRAVSFPNMTALSITSNNCVGTEAFRACKIPNLTSITIGDNCSLGNNVFQSMTFYADLRVNVGACTTFGTGVFTSATAANNSKWIVDGLQTVSASTFKSMAGSFDLYIYGAQTVEDSAFESAASLKSVTFDSYLETIYGNKVFKGCSALTKVVMTRPLNPQITTYTVAFDSLPSGLKFYVPLNLLNTYVTDTQWITYVSRFDTVKNIVDDWNYTIISGDSTDGYDIAVNGYTGTAAISGNVLTIPASIVSGGVTYNIVRLDAGLLNTATASTVQTVRIPDSVYTIDNRLFCSDQFTLSVREVQVADTSTYFRAAGGATITGYTTGYLLENASGTILYKVMPGYCTNNSITSITLNYNTIFAGALDDCTTLDTVVVGTNLSYITEGLFNFTNSNIKVIYFTSTTPPVLYGTMSLGNIVEMAQSGTELVYQVTAGGCIYVPLGSESIYKTAPGFTAYAIAIQGYVHTHTPVAFTDVAATCTTAGHTDGTYCSVCGATVTAPTVVPATGHSWSSWAKGTDPSDTATGTLVRTCSNVGCTDTPEYYPLPTLTQANTTANGGPYTYTETQAATSTTTGTGEYSITVDGQIFTYTVTIPVHTMGSWSQTAAPDASNTGTLTRNCTASGCTYSETYTLLALDSANVGANTGQYSYTVTTPATTSDDGVGTYSITVDGQTFTYNVTLPATGGP